MSIAKSSERAPAQSPERVLVVSRVFDAPRAIVWKAWTDPEHLARWWGPHGFTTTVRKMDLRAGGAWRISMQSPEGRVDRQVGAFRKIVEPELLEFSYAFEDEAGNAGHETVVTVTFTDQNGKTKLVVNQAEFETVAVRDDHVRGWGEALDHLAAYCAKAKSNQRNAPEMKP